MHDPFTTQAPDPYKTIFEFSANGIKTQVSGTKTKHTHLRAQILAATRRLLAEEGHDRIRLRSISEACSITAQTIHNSFGCKFDLLRSALNEHTLMIDSTAYRSTASPEAFLRLAIAYCQSAIDRPDFMREFMSATFSSKHSLREPLMAFGVEMKTRFLTTMAERNLLKPCVNPRVTAEQIAYTNAFALGEWAESGDTAKLYEKLLLGNGTILLGILTPTEAWNIERWLCDPMNRKWQPQRIVSHLPETTNETDAPN